MNEKTLQNDSKSPKEKERTVPGKPSLSETMKYSPKDKNTVVKCDTKRVDSPRNKGSPPYRINTSVGQELRSTYNGKSNPVLGSLSVETNHKESHGASAHRSSSLSPSAADGPASASSQLPPTPAKLPQGLYGHTGLLSPYFPSLGLPMYPGYALANHAAAASLLGAAGAVEQKAEPNKHVTVTHATVKTISGATTLVPVCSDPGCSQCRLTVQAAQFTPSCPPGCTDCPRDGHRALASSSSSLPGLQHPALAALHPLARLHPSLYSSAHTDLRNGQHSPPSPNQHICSWVASGKYCGEQFSTSEELMSHLRSHTSSLDPALGLSTSALPSAYHSLTHPSLALSHLYGLPATTLSSLSSSASVRNGPYGRSVSPSSLLSSSRFHPYMKSPLSHIPASLPSGYPSAPPSLSSFPGLYSLPGSRLGPLVP